MAHKTLIGGTAYNIIGGKSLVSGTSYNIKGGKTLVGGTGYSISFNFTEPEPLYAMYYSDNSIVFQYGNIPDSGKTLKNSYTNFDGKSFMNSTQVPWNAQLKKIQSIHFKNGIKTTSMTSWFSFSGLYSCNIKTVDITNLKIDSIYNMYNTFGSCCNLKGTPFCGNKVTNMAQAYYYCSNFTGSPVCGPNVTDMHNAFYNCCNLTGSPACGDKVVNLYKTYEY